MKTILDKPIKAKTLKKKLERSIAMDRWECACKTSYDMPKLSPKNLNRMNREAKTATQLMNEHIEIPCYLCGKGKIGIRAGDIDLRTPHPYDYIIQQELKQYLLKYIKKFFDTKIIYK